MYRMIFSLLVVLAAASAVICAQEKAKTKAAAPPAVKSAPAAATKAAPAAPAAPAPAGEADAVQQTVQAYVDAFNKHDAAALSAMWAAQGVYVDRQTGERTTGREAIAADLQQNFKDNPNSKLSAEITGKRLVRPDVASVDGHVSLVFPGENATVSSFSAILVKEGGKWLFDSIEETSLPSPESAQEALADLEWLIGRWVDQAHSGRVHTTVRWGAGNSFLVRSFVVEDEEGETQQGTQVIGWDPRLKQIRSWSFFSDGSFGEGQWSKNGDEWLIKSTQTLEDGKLASGVHVLKRVDDNTVTLQVIGREVDGVPTASDEPITAVRAQEPEKAAGAGGAAAAADTSVTK